MVNFNEHRVVLILRRAVLLSYCLAIPILTLSAQQLAFPGAEGYGRFTSGGRGGKLLAVTTLKDSGPGSLRAAINTPGTRTIVFRVSGNISLQSELIIQHGNLTIAGQTAPGAGICLKDFPLIVDADNVIVRYIRVRLGDLRRLEADALSVIFRKDIIIDHCSFSWGIDEVATIRDNERTTVQWCLISESLNRSYHSKGPHGYGGIWGGKGVTFHHNLFAHHSSRTPRFNGSRYHRQPDKELVDFRNNVIYNWGHNGAYGGEGGRYNLVGNYYKYGPATRHKDRIVEPWDAAGKWFVAENFVFGYPEITADNWAGGVQGEFQDQVRATTPHAAPPVRTQLADEAFELVLSDVGAVLPRRDELDSRVLDEVRSGSARYGATSDGIIDSQTAVGGWPELLTHDVPADQDHDGMADDWERANGLNPQDPADGNGDLDSDGYTNLEEYLNALTERGFETMSKKSDGQK